MRPQYWFSRAHLSAEDCDKIITFGESYPSQDGTVGLNDGNFGVNDMRRSIVRWLPRQSDVGHMMMQLFTHANRDFAFACAEIYNIQFTEYRGDNSGHYDWHADVSWGPTPNMTGNYQCRFSFPTQMKIAVEILSCATATRLRACVIVAR